MKNLPPFFLGLCLVPLTQLTNAGAAPGPIDLRWTGKDDPRASLRHVTKKIRAKTGVRIQPQDLLLFEERDLATSHFQTWIQTVQGEPLADSSIRIWTHPKTGKLIQLDARIQDPTPAEKTQKHYRSVGDTLHTARAWIQSHSEDTALRGVKWRDSWFGSRLSRTITFQARRGKHVIRVDLETGLVADARYEAFPRGEFAIWAPVYPIYEEVEGTGRMQTREPKELRYLQAMIPVSGQDPFEPLRRQQYLDEQYDPIRGMTTEGRALGFWSMTFLKQEAARLTGNLPQRPNQFESGGVALSGRYATVNLHPDAVTAFTGINFIPQPSARLLPHWQPVAEANGAWKMTPTSGFLGKPLLSASESNERPARRLPNHDPLSYINDGFDELQVYYAVNQLFDSLKPMGFTDTELSTRPFHAFMYDPDIEMKDNAYYTDDTINFTTYSPSSLNYARDNSTIWHELGHGVMDRMMGDLIRLADTGGLSEGMADFIAALVIADVTGNKPFDGSDLFRIINQTGFNLTNEVHDDGEAYGGAMKDMLDAAISQFGTRQGLHKITDLTLEAMRLSRNHPGLDAQGWFGRMLFADELGAKGVRAPGELRGLILKALDGRNFSLDGSPVAALTLTADGQTVESQGPGSRNAPIPVIFGAGSEEASYSMGVKLEDGKGFKFQYPVTVKVEYRKGALQGAIHWVGEESGPQTFVLASSSEAADFRLRVSSQCDEVNRPDGGCVDYAYVQIFNAGEIQPRAKKRFYLKIKR